jgi:hypothetical protein
MSFLRRLELSNIKKFLPKPEAFWQAGMNAVPNLFSNEVCQGSGGDAGRKAQRAGWPGHRHE